MITNKLITYISFAKKSGSLNLGFDSVKFSILSRKSNLVLFLSDASEKTKKQIKRLADINNINCLNLNLSSQDLIKFFYKKVVVISIDDKNLSSAIFNLINNNF
ncbi:MAG: ribosomal L7Ae/L30e/S12e/Gadd45 family protein [Oscillospiraceae bacterium]|nr:ribosomal L7Ae/L30e/S12e/Gadd45 family protein [Oscillospiraceae bacterium]